MTLVTSHTLGVPLLRYRSSQRIAAFAYFGDPLGALRANPDAGPLAHLLLRGEGKRRTQADPAGLASFLRVLILPLFGVRPCPRLRDRHCRRSPVRLGACTLAHARRPRIAPYRLAARCGRSRCPFDTAAPAAGREPFRPDTSPGGRASQSRPDEFIPRPVEGRSDVGTSYPKAGPTRDRYASVRVGRSSSSDRRLGGDIVVA